MDWNNYDAALFDLDGVLTPTAEVHMRAWEQMFSEFLSSREEVEPPYHDSDYFNFIDGKPRYEGVQSFLGSRNIELPYGEPSDASNAETVCGLGNRKNEVFSAILADDGVQPYPGSVVLIEDLKRRGVAMAVVSSSRNAPAVLTAAGLDDRFEIVVDGTVAAQQALAGKPSPETFVYAAQLCQVAPARAVVFEDALSGVQAGHAGDFGLVVGVDRGVGIERLTAAGADRVVRDLAELVER